MSNSPKRDSTHSAKSRKQSTSLEFQEDLAETPNASKLRLYRRADADDSSGVAIVLDEQGVVTLHVWNLTRTQLGVAQALLNSYVAKFDAETGGDE